MHNVLPLMHGIYCAQYIMMHELIRCMRINNVHVTLNISSLYVFGIQTNPSC